MSVNEFEAACGGPLAAARLDTIGVNVGLRCNLSCTHCHLECGPSRSECMDKETFVQVLAAVDVHAPTLVDVTGGAPEYNPHLPWFLAELAARGPKGPDILVRSNACVLLEPGLGTYFDLYARLKVGLVVSLPCYLKENVEAMRGKGSFELILTALRRLNARGYGAELPLHLVFNGLSASLPPDQAGLEDDYRQRLRQEHGIEFTRLFALANAPVGRFKKGLAQRLEEQAYARLLKESFNKAAVDSLMCASQIWVGHDGRLYDCDFNYALGIGTCDGPAHVAELAASAPRGRRIRTASHCFVCTAGQGSSCQGSLSAA